MSEQMISIPVELLKSLAYSISDCADVSGETFDNAKEYLDKADVAASNSGAQPPQADNSDYAKCADDILKLELADEIINKHGCLVAILKRHFA